MRRSSFHNLLLLGVLFWCLLIILPPICMMAGSEFTPLANTLYKSFSPICHQYDSRSLHLAGYKLAVCSRCTAIYLGFLVGVIVSRFLSRRRIDRTLLWWIIAVVPMLVDVVLDIIAIHASNVPTRLLTGGVFGIVAALVLTPYFIQACTELIHHKSQGVAYEPKA